MSLIGYARVSTAEGRQSLDRRLDALNAAACERVFEDRASGATSDRPNLTACLDYLPGRPRPGFAVELIAKDHRLMAALGESRRIKLSVNQRALELCEEMCESGYARRDNVASVEYFRTRARTPAPASHPIDRGAPFTPAVEGSTETPPPNTCTAAASRRSGR